MKAEIRSVTESSTRKLFQVADPAVRLWIITDLMNGDEDDPLYRQTVEECRNHPVRRRLLESLREDGTWPISPHRRKAEERGPGPPVGWTYITILRNLHNLGDLQAGIDKQLVKTALERILGWQREEGYIPGPLTDAFPMPHYNGYALRNIIQFGEEEDPRSQKLIRWLLSMQRDDGGWNIPYIQDVRYLPQYKHMRSNDFWKIAESKERPPYDPKEYQHIPSCLWSTMMVVRGLAWSPRMRHTRECRRGAEFFLDGFFKRNYHKSFYGSERNWTVLRHPAYFGNGLCALDILTVMGYGSEDERMEKPIRWLLDARSKDGFWYKSDRPAPGNYQWITVTALCALSRFAKSY
ncbi:MAG: terpene cyclase/mutase family protein [Thermoplasmata archaeon]|nr:terpene cyclase/mutase family protein [Thermoplasmata archaeon]